MTIRSIEYAKNVQQINVLSWQLSTEEQQKNRISKCQGWGYPVSYENRFKRFNSFLTHQTWSSLGKRSGHFQGSFRVVHTYFHNAWTIWIMRFNPSRSKLFFFVDTLCTTYDDFVFVGSSLQCNDWNNCWEKIQA